MAQPEQSQHVQDVSELSDLIGTEVSGAAEEFTAEQRERLARLKRALARGERSDSYPVDKRLDFIRWLIEQGKLSEN